MICKNCNTEIPDGCRFCTACGAPVESPADEAVTELLKPEAPAFEDSAETELLNNPAPATEPQPAFEPAYAPLEDEAATEILTEPAVQPQPVFEPVQNVQPQPIFEPVQNVQPQPTNSYVPPVGPVVTPPVNTPVNMPAPTKEKKKINFKVIGIICAIVVVLVGAVVGVKLFMDSRKTAEMPFIYINEDGDLIALKSFKEDAEKFVIAKDLDDFDEEYYQVSEDGKYIAYVDNKDKLMLKKLFDKKDEGVKLDSNIERVVKVVGNADAIYYISDDSFCCANKKGETEEICDALYAGVNKDNTYAYAIKEKETEDSYNEIVSIVKLNGLKSEAVEITSKGQNFDITQDYSKFYYTEGDEEKGYTLYEATFNDPDGKEIADGVKSFIVSGDKLYYTVKNSGEKLTYYSFVEDDLDKTSADSLKEPVYDDYFKDIKEPNADDFRPDVDSSDPNYDMFLFEAEAKWDKAWEDYNKAYDEASKKYDADYEEYSTKKNAIEDADYLRESLKEAQFDAESYELYMYDGKKSELINDSTAYISRITINGVDTGVKPDFKITADTYSKSLKNVSKLKLSTLVEDKYNATETIYDHVYKDMKVEVNTIDGAKLTAIGEATNESNLYIKTYVESTGEYIVTKTNHTESEIEDGERTSYTAYAVKNGQTLDDATVLSEECYDISVCGKDYFTFEDYNSKSDSYTLFVNGKEPSGNEDLSTTAIISTRQDTSTLYFAGDYNEDLNTYTVYKYSNGKLEKVCEDVKYFGIYSFAVVGKDTYAYIDEDDKLMCKKGDKTFKLDKDVEEIVSSNMTYHNFNY